MASTNKCEYCGSTITSEDQSCPNCGAANPLYVVDLPRRVTDPRTIEELQEYCAERGMPLLRMRFFIGEDFREPRAFGIYKDGNEFVVYKNKADGSRAVRYRGPDEAYAVGQIYDKLIEECHNRGIYPDGRPANRSSYSNRSSGYGGSSYDGGNGRNRRGGNLTAIIIVIAIVITIWLIAKATAGSNGYYSGSYGNGYSGYSGYSYDYDNGGSYSYDYDNGSSSSWWSDDNSSSSSWDSDWGSDWGSDWSDWDSGDSDWDSEW